MAFAARVLRPIRASLAASSPSSSAALPLSTPPVRRAEFGIAKAWFEGIRPAVRDRQAPQLSWRFSFRTLCGRSFGRAGSKVGTFIGISVIFGSLHPWPHVTFSLDGGDTAKNDERANTWDEPNPEDSPKAFWALARKLWLPIFFLVTVLLNWDHPIELAMRSILFLLSTKPSPLSVYLPIEKLCSQPMHQDSDLYRLKVVGGLCNRFYGRELFNCEKWRSEERLTKHRDMKREQKLSSQTLQAELPSSRVGL